MKPVRKQLIGIQSEGYRRQKLAFFSPTRIERPALGFQDFRWSILVEKERLF